MDLVGFLFLTISVRFGRIRSDSVGFGLDLVGFGRIWLDSVGVAAGRGPKFQRNELPLGERKCRRYSNFRVCEIESVQIFQISCSQIARKFICIRYNNTQNFLFSLLSVVTGATDGIGKAIAKQVCCDIISLSYLHYLR